MLNASAVLESAITSKSEKVGTTPHLATLPFSLLDFLRIVYKFQGFF